MDRRFSYPKNTKHHLIGFFLLGTLFTWKFLLFISLPFVNTDGPWTLSKTFSFLNGYKDRSLFAHDYAGDIFKVSVFEYINAPFFLIYPENTYSIIFHNFLLILSCLALLFLIFWKKNKEPFLFFLSSVTLLTSTYTYGMRSEIYAMPWLLAIITLTNKEYQSKIHFKLIIIATLAAISSLLHPAAAIAATLIILYWLVEKNAPLPLYIILLLSGSILLFILSKGNLLSYIHLYAYSNELENHSLKLTLFPKYLIFSLGILPLATIAIKARPLFNTIFFISFIITFMSLGRSYYFQYLFPFLIIMIQQNIQNIHPLNILDKYYHKTLILISITFASVFTHLYPTVALLENPTYASAFREILKKVNHVQNKLDGREKIWVPSQLGMEVIQKENSRLFFPFYPTMAEKKIILQGNDVMLFYSQKDMEELLPKIVGNQITELETKQLLPKTKGIIRIGDFFKSRSDSIGLWEVHLQKDNRKNYQLQNY